MIRKPQDATRKLPEDDTRLPISLQGYQKFTAKEQLQTESHEQSYLMGELESLGLTSIRLNEFNNNAELKTLVMAIKEDFIAEYRKSMTGAVA
jgi:hypothetical protein